MGKRQAQRNVAVEEIEEDDTEAVQIAQISRMAFAVELVNKMFESTEPPEVTFGVFDRFAVDADSDEEAAEDLIKAHVAAKEIFKTEKPTPSMTFGMFDRVFENLDDDDEE